MSFPSRCGSFPVADGYSRQKKCWTARQWLLRLTEVCHSNRQSSVNTHACLSKGASTMSCKSTCGITAMPSRWRHSRHTRMCAHMHPFASMHAHRRCVASIPTTTTTTTLSTSEKVSRPPPTNSPGPHSRTPFCRTATAGAAWRCGRRAGPDGGDVPAHPRRAAAVSRKEKKRAWVWMGGHQWQRWPSL